MKTSSSRAAAWLVKSEPSAYAWTDLVRDGKTDWTGVRNNAARLHLRGMQVGDPVLFYHSVEAKSVVGVAKVTKPAFPDPTDRAGGWVAVQIAADRPLGQPVTLAQIRSEPALKDIALLRQSRLSVMPLTAAEFKKILALGGR